jgi:hypothetical protein
VVMRVSMRIWFVALIPAFFYGLFRVLKKDDRYVFLLIWSLFIFTFFSASSSKLIWYIIPLYPAVSIIIGSFIKDSVDFAFEKLKISSCTFGQYFVFFSIGIFGLMYFYFNRDMVYTSDLTGSKARMLQLKDETFGTESEVYVHDLIEKPLVLFYTDSPYESVAYSDLKRVIASAGPKDEVLFVTKSGRFQSLAEEFAGVSLVGQDNEWVLGRREPEPPPEPLLPLIEQEDPTW